MWDVAFNTAAAEATDCIWQTIRFIIVGGYKERYECESGVILQSKFKDSTLVVQSKYYIGSVVESQGYFNSLFSI